MKRNPTKIALILLLLCFNGLYAQVMLKEISFKEQITNSTMIVEGEVIAKTSFWSNNLIYTANTVKVHKVFKGDPLKTVEVITVGGVVGDKALMVSHGLKLQKGTTGLFMLEDSDVVDLSTNKSTIKQFKPYSDVQGFYRYNLFDDLAVNPFKVKQGITSSLYNDILAITKKDYLEISDFNVEQFNKLASQNKTLAPIIAGFSPTTLSAGTKTQLTISGSGFGGSGKVSFSDADLGGEGAYIDALATQIVSWSDTEIVVEVPSGAGTGKIRVTDDSTPVALSTDSATDLTVSYSELNFEFNPGTGLEAYPLQHYGQSEQTFGDFGYQWRMQTQFFNDTEHPGAKAAFERALETWRCTTLINWTIGSSATPVGIAAADDINVITFDNESELANGVLGTCYYWIGYYTGCSTGPSVQAFVSELDIVFDTDGTDWNFGPGATTVFGEYDFETVALHELGHGHVLGHVIDTDAVMHYALSFNEDQRSLNSDDINGASDVQARSNTISVCGILQPMTDYAGTCSLSINDTFLNDAVQVYPNPSNGEVFITNDQNINLKSLTIFEMSGRKIADFDLSGNSKTKVVNFQNVSKGMYLISIYSDQGFVTKKLILE